MSLPEKTKIEVRRVVLIATVGAVVTAAVMTAVQASGSTRQLVTTHPSNAVTGPDYAAVADACSLLDETILSAYLSGAADTTQPYQPPLAPAGTQSADCEWITPRLTSLTLAVNISGSAKRTAVAKRNYESAIAADMPNAAGGKLSVPALGDCATALIDVRTGTSAVDTDLVVWSGNAEIELDFAAMPSSPSGVLAEPGDGYQPVTTLKVLAYAVLAALAHPGQAAPAAAWPRYGPPPHSCLLVSGTTLAGYMHDAKVDSAADSLSTPADGLQQATCQWSTNDSSLTVIFSLDGAAAGLAGAQQEFESALLSDHSKAGETVTGASPVLGLGDLATAITESDSRSRYAILLVWSGNAVIEVDYRVGAGVGTGPAAQVKFAESVVSNVLSHLHG